MLTRARCLIVAAALASPACVTEMDGGAAPDAGADDPNPAPDAAPPIPLSGVVTHPRHGDVIAGATASLALEIGGVHGAPDEAIEVQLLAAPTDLTSWTSIAVATTASSPDADGMYAWYAPLVPAAGAPERWPQGGILRLRAVDSRGRVLAGLYHDAGACLADAAPDWPSRVGACGAAFETGIAIVSPNASPNRDFAARPRFLDARGAITPDETLEYYAAIDAPATVDEFNARFGLDDPAVPVATYYNAGDLAVGREIRCGAFVQPGGLPGAACMTANYGAFSGDPDLSLAAAVAGNQAGNSEGAFAFVAMVYQAPITAPNAVQFMVYGPDRTLVTEALLDRHGDNTSIPNNCLNCHGSSATYDPATNVVLGAKFLPFDPRAFAFSAEPGYAAADQMAAIAVFNDVVAATEPSLAVTELIDGIFADPAAPNLDFVPSGWNQTDADRRVYREVIAPFCSGCHISRGPAGARDVLDFSTADGFRIRAQQIGFNVCAPTELTHAMPNAEAVLDRFWPSPARAYLVEALGLATPCAAP